MDKKREETELERIADARQERGQMQERLNSFYSLAVPHRPRIGATNTYRRVEDLDEQDEIFDGTLQECVSDFASDQVDDFMPYYKPWVELEPGTALSSTADENSFKEQSKEWQEKLYDLIGQTNWYEQNLEVFHDVAGAAAGTIIPHSPPGQDVKVRSVLMHNLIMDEGGFSDLDGRWDEFHSKKRKVIQMFGDDIQKDMPKDWQSKGPNTSVEVIQGGRYEMTDKGPRFIWMVFLDKKLARWKKMPVGVPAPMNVARWRTAPPAAWGPGPADVALTAARTLDELAYLNLRKLGKEADPPMSFEADGVFEPEGGIDNGTYVARRMGSAAPTPLFEPSRSQNTFFERDQLYWSIKKALYQDKPEQAGKTPPTASQWIDEKTLHEKRKQARRRIYKEYILPSLRRFAHVFAMRGELEPITIDGETIQAKFVSPLSKASDGNEVSAGMQFAQSSVGIFSEAALAVIDVKTSMENWQKKLGDTTVALQDPPEQDDLTQDILREGRNIV